MKGSLAPAAEPAWSPYYLAAIVDSSDDAIIGKTLDGTIVSWNRGAERIYRYRADEMIGRSISILVPPDRPDELPQILERLRHGERIDHYQTVRVRKDGHQIPVSVTISPVLNAEGLIVGASAIARDMSAQEKATSEALALREEFISIAAHELRTPMSTVYGRLQLAERYLKRADIDRESALRDVVFAREAAERLVALVDRLLDLSRLKSGRVDLARAPIDVVELARRVAALLADTHGREIVVYAASSAGASAHVDGLRVEQVLSNLLDNAVKYSPAGTPIQIEVTSTGDAVRVAVRDHGPGVPEDQRELIFGPFHRANGSGPGVGLGLYVAREIMRLHEGSLELESPIGGGATFVMTLPREPM